MSTGTSPAFFSRSGTLPRKWLIRQRSRNSWFAKTSVAGSAASIGVSFDSFHTKSRYQPIGSLAAEPNRTPAAFVN